MTKEYYSVDRVEDGFVVVEDSCGNTKTHPANDFAFDVKGGDVVVYHNGKFILDEDETQHRKEDVSSLLKKLRAKK